MRALVSIVLIAAACLSAGCSKTSAPAVGARPATATDLYPDASASTGATWTTFTAPGSAFTVEAPAPLSADTSDSPLRRFSSPRVPGRVVYEVGYIDIDPRDAGVPRPQLVEMLVRSLTKSASVEYRQDGGYLKAYPSQVLRFVADNEDQVLAHIFAGQKRLWLIQVIVPATFKDISQVPTQRFMRSLKPNDTPPPASATRRREGLEASDETSSPSPAVR